MKTNFIVTTVLLASFTNSVMANQVTLLNHSPAKYHPMTVVYKIAYKNPKQPVVFGSPQMIQLDKETTLQFDMKNYQLAGIVPVSIDGHVLPDNINQFGKPQQCSLATDRQHHSGELIFIYQFSQNHWQLTCGTRGGVFG